VHEKVLNIFVIIHPEEIPTMHSCYVVSKLFFGHAIFYLCLIILSSLNCKGSSSVVTSFINISHVMSLILFSFSKDFLNFQFSQDNVTKGVGKKYHYMIYQILPTMYNKKTFIKKFLCSQ
jgi:hypothetical protein